MNNESLSLDEALARAKSFSRKGRLEDAMQLYQGILTSFPQHKKARKALKQLEKRYNNSGGSQLHQDMSRLMSLYSQGEAGEAMTLATELGNRYPDQPLPFNIAGALTLEKTGPEAAIELFKRAIEIEPTYPDAQSNLANIFLSQGQYELANQHYEIAVSHSPRDADLRYYLGRAKRGIKRDRDGLEQWQSALAIDPNHLKSLIAAGFLFTDDDQLGQAEAHFRRAIEIDQESAGALSGLGYALKKAGRTDEAIDYLERALALSPDKPHIEYILNALKGNSTDAPPEGYVADLFDAFAEDFEKQLVENLEYDAPNLLQVALSRVAPQIERFDPALDIGCGTGLCAVAFKDLVGSIDGLDVSANMVEKARDKNLYRNLWLGDAMQVLSTLEDKYRLLIAVDVFVYLGNLEPLFTTLAQHVSGDAYFAFSTEHTEDGEFTLDKIGRYKHSRDYIERVALKAGFKTIHFETFNLRKESGDWVIGGGYILHST